MANNDKRQAAEAAEFKQKLEAMVAAADDTKKKAAAARSRVLAATALLEEEQRAAAALDEVARAAALMIEPPSPSPVMAVSASQLSDAIKSEAAIVANLHVQASGV
jgi:hypothetical protein